MYICIIVLKIQCPGIITVCVNSLALSVGVLFRTIQIFLTKIPSFESTSLARFCLFEIICLCMKFMLLKCFFHLLLAVSISFENYRAVHPAYRDDEEDDEEVDQDEMENRKSAWGTSVFILICPLIKAYCILFSFFFWS